MGQFISQCGPIPGVDATIAARMNWIVCAFEVAKTLPVCISSPSVYPYMGEMTTDIRIAVLDVVLPLEEGLVAEFQDSGTKEWKMLNEIMSWDWEETSPGLYKITLWTFASDEYYIYNYPVYCAAGVAPYVPAGGIPEPEPPPPPPPEQGMIGLIFTSIALLFEDVSNSFHSLATNTEGIWLIGGVISSAFEWIGDLIFDIAYYMDDVGWRLDQGAGPVAWIAEQIAAIIARVDHLYDDLYNVVHGIMYPEMLKLNDLWYNFGVHVRDKILSTLFDFRFGAATVQKTLVQFLTEAWEMIIQLYDNFGAYVLEAIQGWPAETWAWFRQKLKEDWGIPTSVEELTAFVVAIVNSLIGWIPGSLEELKQLLDLGTWLKDFSTNIVGFVTDRIGTIVDAALTWVDDQVDAYKQRLWNLAEKIMERL